MNLNTHKSEILKLTYRDLLIFLMPLLVFSIYLSIYNPGILTLDSFNQLHQIATNEFTNQQPFFHTFIEMLCIKIFGNTISIAILQILIFSSMWTAICKYHRDDDDSNSNTFFIQAVITLVICLIPINAIYSITLWEDILFCYFLMFLCFLIKVMLDKNGNVDFKYVILLALTMSFVSQLNQNGIYVVIPTLIILSVYLFRKKLSRSMHIFLPALTIMFILIIMSLNVAYNVEDSQTDYVFVKTAHMLSDYDLHLNLNDADKNKIHKMIPESKINKSYKIYYPDEIGRNANKQIFDSDRDSYLGMAASYSMQNPMNFLFYMFKSADIVWDITRDTDWTGESYYITKDGSNIESTKDKYFASINSTPKESYEDLDDINHGTDRYKSLNSFVNTAKTNIVLDTLFNSPALYMYLAIILLILMQVLFKTKKMYLVYLPNLFNIIIVFLTIPVQDNRYLYSNQLVFYLLVIILISLLLNSKRESAPTSLKTPETYEKIITEGNNKFENYNDLNENYEFEDIYLTEDIHAEMPREEINLQTEKTPEETSSEAEDELIAKILKEMEMEKQDKK